MNFELYYFEYDKEGVTYKLLLLDPTYIMNLNHGRLPPREDLPPIPPVFEALTDDDIPELCQYLLGHQEIMGLLLSNNHFTDAGIIKLAQFLVENDFQNLTGLTLEDCKFNPDNPEIIQLLKRTHIQEITGVNMSYEDGQSKKEFFDGGEENKTVNGSHASGQIQINTELIKKVTDLTFLAANDSEFLKFNHYLSHLEQLSTDKLASIFHMMDEKNSSFFLIAIKNQAHRILECLSSPLHEHIAAYWKNKPDHVKTLFDTACSMNDVKSIRLLLKAGFGQYDARKHCLIYGNGNTIDLPKTMVLDVANDEMVGLTEKNRKYY